MSLNDFTQPAPHSALLPTDAMTTPQRTGNDQVDDGGVAVLAVRPSRCCWMDRWTMDIDGGDGRTDTKNGICGHLDQGELTL